MIHPAAHCPHFRNFQVIFGNCDGGELRSFPLQHMLLATRNARVFKSSVLSSRVTVFGRVRTEAQKAAAKRKRAENPEATKKASQKWKAENPDEVKKGHDIWARRVRLRT